MSLYKKEYYEKNKEAKMLSNLLYKLKTGGSLNLKSFPDLLFVEYLGGTKQEVIAYLDLVVKNLSFPKKAYNKTKQYKIVSILEGETRLPKYIRNNYKNLTIVKV